MFQLKPFSQMDPAWKNTLLGFDYSSTIGQYGCLLTCLTMVADGFGASETPASLNDKMKSAGGFLGDLVVPGALSSVAPQTQYVKRIQCNNPPAPLGEIDDALNAGLPVIVKVDYSPVAGVQDHWIVLVGKQGSDYLIQDPWPNPPETTPVLLTKRYGFAGSPDHIILDTLFFTSAALAKPKPPANPKPIPANAMVVQSNVDGLALRSQPLVTPQSLIERVGLGAKLIILEDPVTAKDKVGSLSSWLAVQVDADRLQGFVAAWYVAPLAQDAPPTPPITPTPPTPPPPVPAQPGLVVYAATDGLAFRSQPQLGDATLIRRVPLNTQFSVLDPVDQANARIGVNGQWLNVRDVQGTLGYVAAWYVAKDEQKAPLGPTPLPTPTNPPPPPPPAAGLTLRTTVEGVALRSQAVISPLTVIKRMALGAELVVLEPAAGAQAKIGVLNQWINVRDINGAVGYVAAWYVVKTPLAAPAATPA